jgi:hypothetical protein
MSNKDRVLGFIRQFPGRDDDDISQTLSIKPRQSINQICRNLEREGFIERKNGKYGKICNFPLDLPKIPSPRQGPEIKLFSSIETQNPQDWFWEGNVSNALAGHLRGSGWAIVSQADTASKQRGIDVVANRDGKNLLIEVKGYPSIYYRDSRRAGETKPTNPSLQAQHWFSHALLKVMRLRGQNNEALVGMAFPDFPKYRTLANEIATSIESLGIVVFFVSETGAVSASGL